MEFDLCATIADNWKQLFFFKWNGIYLLFFDQSFLVVQFTAVKSWLKEFKDGSFRQTLICDQGEKGK